MPDTNEKDFLAGLGDQLDKGDTPLPPSTTAAHAQDVFADRRQQAPPSGFQRKNRPPTPDATGGMGEMVDAMNANNDRERVPLTPHFPDDDSDLHHPPSMPPISDHAAPLPHPQPGTSQSTTPRGEGFFSKLLRRNRSSDTHEPDATTPPPPPDHGIPPLRPLDIPPFRPDPNIPDHLKGGRIVRGPDRRFLPDMHMGEKAQRVWEKIVANKGEIAAIGLGVAGKYFALRVGFSPTDIGNFIKFTAGFLGGQAGAGLAGAAERYYHRKMADTHDDEAQKRLEIYQKTASAIRFISQKASLVSLGASIESLGEVGYQSFEHHILHEDTNQVAATPTIKPETPTPTATPTHKTETPTSTVTATHTPTSTPTPIPAGTPTPPVITTPTPGTGPDQGGGITIHPGQIEPGDTDPNTGNGNTGAGSGITIHPGQLEPGDTDPGITPPETQPGTILPELHHLELTSQYGHTISGTVGTDLQFDGKEWHLVENGEKNFHILAAQAGLPSDFTIDHDKYSLALQNAVELWAKGELTPEEHPFEYALFHAANGTESEWPTIIHQAPQIMGNVQKQDFFIHPQAPVLPENHTSSPLVAQLAGDDTPAQSTQQVVDKINQIHSAPDINAIDQTLPADTTVTPISTASDNPVGGISPLNEDTPTFPTDAHTGLPEFHTGPIDHITAQIGVVVNGELGNTDNPLTYGDAHWDLLSADKEAEAYQTFIHETGFTQVDQQMFHHALIEGLNDAAYLWAKGELDDYSAEGLLFHWFNGTESMQEFFSNHSEEPLRSFQEFAKQHPDLISIPTQIPDTNQIPTAQAPNNIIPFPGTAAAPNNVIPFPSRGVQEDKIAA